MQLSVINDANSNSQNEVKGYIYYLNNKVIGISENPTYSITSLEKETEYTNIYVHAIDEMGKIKKSRNELTVTTPSSLPLIDTDAKIFENWTYRSGNSSVAGNPLSISAHSGCDTVTTVNKIDFSPYKNLYIKAYMARNDYVGHFHIANSSSPNLGVGYESNGIICNSNEFAYPYDATTDRNIELNIDISNCTITDFLTLYTWDATMTIYKVILE